MKTALQQRAESLAREFKKKGRKPVVIEFAGSPKAGKTTTISTVHAFLKRCGFKVETVIERASICPIRDKRHSNFNVWTACTTLAQILEKTQHQHLPQPHPDAPEVLILDRGLFDSIVWLARMEQVAKIGIEDRKLIEQFLLIADWRKRISGVIVMTASASESMSREKGDLPVEGVTGSIMNPEWLAQFKESILQTCARLERQFRIFRMDTSQVENTRAKVAEKVAGIVLDLVGEQIEEDILCAKRDDVVRLFSGKDWASGAVAVSIANLFVKGRLFVPRAEAEDSKDLVQALPVVVVRTRSGRVLQLRRREKSETNPLHERLTIWAGGHVRKEDATNGDCLICGASRELQEELRLSAEPESLDLLGAIYCNSGGSTSKHVAIVYEWKAPNDDLDIVLSGTEFFERRGTSLSGKFVEVSDLRTYASSTSHKLEPWSELIVRKLLDGGHELAEGCLL